MKKQLKFKLISILLFLISIAFLVYGHGFTYSRALKFILLIIGLCVCAVADKLWKKSKETDKKTEDQA